MAATEMRAFCLLMLLAVVAMGCEDGPLATGPRLDLFEQESAPEATRARALLAVVSLRSLADAATDADADAGLDAGLGETPNLRLVIDSRDALLCTTGIVPSEQDSGVPDAGRRDAGVDAGAMDAGSLDGGALGMDAGAATDDADCRRQVIYRIRPGIPQQRFVTIVLANAGIDTPLVVGSIVDERGQVLVSVPRRLGLTRPLDAGPGDGGLSTDSAAPTPTADAGASNDGGAPDAGARTDSGTAADAGSDGGVFVDGGSDGGVDAG